MINFRYHVVSLTAVFLALAVGLVLGSTVLNGPMLDYIENRVDNIARDNRQLRDQVSFLEEELDQEQDFAAEAAPLLLSGQLATRQVLLVELPGGGDYTAGVADALELAGATVVGQLQVTDRFTHPQYRLGELLDLAHQSLPPTVDGDAMPGNSDGVETSAALLAAVLLRDGGIATGEGDGGDPVPATVPEEDRRAVISAYVTSEYLAEVTPVSGPADLVVMVTGLPDTEGEDPDARNGALLTALTQFATTGPTLVAGSGVAGDGNLVAEVRRDANLVAEVSTVDNAAAPQGQVAVGLAAAERLRGQAGHYGLGDGAERLLPEPSSSDSDGS